jgi:hypothetical protein
LRASRSPGSCSRLNLFLKPILTILGAPLHMITLGLSLEGIVALAYLVDGLTSAFRVRARGDGDRGPRPSPAPVFRTS